MSSIRFHMKNTTISWDLHMLLEEPSARRLLENTREMGLAPCGNFQENDGKVINFGTQNLGQPIFRATLLILACGKVGEIPGKK